MKKTTARSGTASIVKQYLLSRRQREEQDRGRLDRV
jgi:hypothetical protein